VVLEAELGARLSARERASALAAELEQARQRQSALAAELERLRRQTAELEAERDSLHHRFEGSERALNNIKGSASWKLTEPLRQAKRQAARVKR
jgi:predicted  nucleic acid-binding Zn-ribbon protein